MIGKVKLTQPKPPVHRFHYSNPESQGALLCETPRFPSEVDIQELIDGYIDRISIWHPEGYERAFKMLDGPLVQALPRLGASQLKEWAKTLFELEDLPRHVRVIYYYNVSSGYDCPHILVINSKKRLDTGEQS